MKRSRFFRIKSENAMSILECICLIILTKMESDCIIEHPFLFCIGKGVENE